MITRHTTYSIRQGKPRGGGRFRPQVWQLVLDGSGQRGRRIGTKVLASKSGDLAGARKAFRPIVARAIEHADPILAGAVLAGEETVFTIDHRDQFGEMERISVRLSGGIEDVTHTENS